ncbi:MAG: hypothetical protein JW913_10645 [Chitinispirillaceae bacterium]|nr:hypothetical protein [Chitinispirillaceae bacterium]
MVGHDSIIPPGREGKVTQEITIGHGYHGTLRKYITVISNAKNSQELRLSLGCTIHAELEIEPAYISLKPDKNGMTKQTLTVITAKKDLQILEVSFTEQEKPGNKDRTNWQVALPILFTSVVTKIDSVAIDGYLKYRLDISQTFNYTTPVYGNFTVKTNHPKKREVAINGVIHELGTGGQ